MEKDLTPDVTEPQLKTSLDQPETPGRTVRTGVIALGIILIGIAIYAYTSAAFQLPEVKGIFQSPSGSKLGTVVMKTIDNGVLITVDALGLKPGLHGLHVHTVGNCAKAADPGTGEVIAFGAAAGHFDPFDTRNHGSPTDDPKLRHAGVLPNLEVQADGTGHLEFVTSKLSILGSLNGVADRAIVIHANTDDFETDPSGNSGARVACAELRPSDTVVTTRYKLPSTDAFPEGIAVDSKRGVILSGAANGGDIWQIQLTSGKASPFALGGSPGRTVALGMHLDNRRRLFVAGGGTGRVAVLNADTGAVVRILEAPPLPKGPQTFINDLTITPNAIFVTDSFRPVIYRARIGVMNVGNLEPWLRLTGTPVQYQDGTNLNGIVSSPDGRYLLTVQSNTGKLFRINTGTRAINEVNLAGKRLTGGDGLVLSGQTLYVVRNAESRIERVDLKNAYASGRLVATRTDGDFRFPTTAALYQNRLLVVNGQLDKQRNPPPVLPFTIVSVPPPSTK